MGINIRNGILAKDILTDEESLVLFHTNPYYKNTYNKLLFLELDINDLINLSGVVTNGIGVNNPTLVLQILIDRINALPISNVKYSE